jgi:CHAD domain-containing protein
VTPPTSLLQGLQKVTLKRRSSVGAGTGRGSPLQEFRLSYRFTIAESVPENVRRIAAEQIQSAISNLKKKDPKKRDERIHEARKSIKRLRALLRLVRPELGRSFRQENTTLRDIGRTLSDLRDSTIVLETFDALSDEPSDKKKLDSVRKGLQQEKKAMEESIEADKSLRSAAEALASVAGRVKEWPLNTDGFDAIAEGLKTEYRGGRKTMPKALKKDDSLLFHEWRKRAKCQLYHMRLLQDLFTDSLQEQDQQLHALETALGDDHNLLILREHLKGHSRAFGGKKSVKECIRLATVRENQLRSQARELGEKIYAQKPKAFVQTLRAEWEQARESHLPPPGPDGSTKRKPVRIPRGDNETAA